MTTTNKQKQANTNNIEKGETQNIINTLLTYRATKTKTQQQTQNP